VRTWLVDTGPLVAYLDAGDPAHGDVAAALDDFTGEIATTSAVVTEAMYFLSAAPEGPTLLADFAVASRLVVRDYSQPATLQQIAGLMRKYADTPMDFADATLVFLATDLDTLDILTLDRRGFATYRTARRKAFRLVV
jgi:uncharacterized protein